MNLMLLNDPAFLQYVVSPVVLSILAGVSWMARNALKKVQQQQIESRKQQEAMKEGLQFLKTLQAGSSTSIEKVRESVVNSHKTNLRDDLDRVTDTLDTVAQTMQTHAEHDRALANTVDGIKTTLAEVLTKQDFLVTMIHRVESRLDSHIERGDG